MGTNMKLTFGFLLISLIALASSGKISAKSEQTAKLTKAANRFTVDLFRKISEENPDKSVISSPVAVHFGLALLSLGARGDTIKELNAALRIPDSDFTKTAFRNSIDKLHQFKGKNLKCANKIFITDDEDYEINPEFQKVASDSFQSEIQKVDFKHPSHAAEFINKWVKEKTESKIEQLVDPKTLKETTKLLLLNAVTFEAKWKKPFKAHDTQKEHFQLSKEKKVELDMMHTTRTFRFAEIEDLNAKAIELPYEDDEFSMVIILPNDVEGLKDVESKLKTGSVFTDACKKLSESVVKVCLPRFKIRTSLKLEDTLKKLDFKQIFDGTGDLSGIIKNKKTLKVSGVIQKGFIEVSEKGTVAAAATAVEASHTSAPAANNTPPIPFVADHPFLFCIKSKDNIPLFFGKYIGK